MKEEDTENFLDNILQAVNALADSFSETLSTSAENLVLEVKTLMSLYEKQQEEQERIVKDEKKKQDKLRRRKAAMEKWVPILRKLDEVGREIELIQPPNSFAATQYPAGAIYQAGFNTLYVTNSKGTDGYLIERVYAPSLKELRWRCSCPHFARVQQTDVPYCKHIYAVDTFLDSAPETLYWMRLLNMFDVCHELKEQTVIHAEQMLLEQLLETFSDVFPDLDILMQET